MKKMNLNELTDYIRSSDDKKIAVIMTTTDCTNCVPILEYTSTKLVDKYPQLEFINFETEDIPLFAPNSIPSMIFFNRGMRSHEGHGLPEPLQAIDMVIDWWLQAV